LPYCLPCRPFHFHSLKNKKWNKWNPFDYWFIRVAGTAWEILLSNGFCFVIYLEWLSDVRNHDTGHNECEPISVKELVQIIIKPFAVCFTTRKARCDLFKVVQRLWLYHYSRDFLTCVINNIYCKYRPRRPWLPSNSFFWGYLVYLLMNGMNKLLVLCLSIALSYFSPHIII